METKSIILEIDVVGALQVKKVFPELVLVMIVPPSFEELRRRLEGRGSENEETMKIRMDRIAYELAQKDKYDYVIVNDDLETAIKEVEQIFDN